MANVWKNATERWQDSVNVVLGVWLMLSPWILQFAAIERAMWNAVLVGVIVAAAALAALVRFQQWEEWVDIAFGLWLVVSPWALGFAALTAAAEVGAMAATWNFVLVGLLIMALAGWSLREAQSRTTRTG